MHNCSLPGGPADANLDEWEYTVTAVAREAKRQGLASMYFDVWNEPNAQFREQCLRSPPRHPPCSAPDRA